MAHNKASLINSLALAVAALASIPLTGTAQAAPGARMSGRTKETGKRLSPRVRARKPGLRAEQVKPTGVRAVKQQAPKKGPVKFGDITLKRGIQAKKQPAQPDIRMNKDTAPGIRMNKATTPGIRMNKAATPGIRMNKATTPGIRMNKAATPGIRMMPKKPTR